MAPFLFVAGTSYMNVRRLTRHAGIALFTAAVVSLLPACAAPAEAGMVIETDSPRVLAARRNTLTLLLREHVGDCEAPCQVTCPAQLGAPVGGIPWKKIFSQLLGNGAAPPFVLPHQD